MSCTSSTPGFERAFHQGQDPDLYLWRDSAGYDVDVLLDLGATQVPVEIKSTPHGISMCIRNAAGGLNVVAWVEEPGRLPLENE